MGIGSYKEAERYRMRTNKNLTRTFYLDTKRTLDEEPFAWEQVQNVPETNYQTEVDPGMVVPPQDVLPKNPIPNMPSAPGIPDPQFRQLELAEGGRVGFKEAGLVKNKYGTYSFAPYRSGKRQYFTFNTEQEGLNFVEKFNAENPKQKIVPKNKTPESILDDITFEINKRNELGIVSGLEDVAADVGKSAELLRQFNREGKIPKLLTSEEIIKNYVDKAVTENKTVDNFTFTNITNYLNEGAKAANSRKTFQKGKTFKPLKKTQSVVHKKLVSDVIKEHNPELYKLISSQSQFINGNPKVLNIEIKDFMENIDNIKNKQIQENLSKGDQISELRILKGKLNLGPKDFAISQAQDNYVKQLNENIKKEVEEIGYDEFAKRRPDLIEYAGKRLDSKTGKIIQRSPEEIQKYIDRGFFSIDHKNRKSGEKINIEFPTNKQIVPNGVNSGFIRSAQAYLKNNIDKYGKDLNTTRNINNIVNEAKKFDFTIGMDEVPNYQQSVLSKNFKGVKNIGGIQAPTVSENILTGFDEQLKKFNLDTSAISKDITIPTEEAFTEIKTGMKGRTQNIEKVLEAAGVTTEEKEAVNLLNNQFNSGLDPATINQVYSKEISLAKKAFGKIPAPIKAVGKIFGLADVALEAIFAIPYLATGDIEGAKRSTTAGLFGYGKSVDEELLEMSGNKKESVQRALNNLKLVPELRDLTEEKKLLEKDLANSLDEEQASIYFGNLNSVNEKIKNIQDKLGKEQYTEEDEKNILDVVNKVAASKVKVAEKMFGPELKQVQGPTLQQNLFNRILEEGGLFESIPETSIERARGKIIPIEIPEIQSPDDSMREGFAEGGGPKVGRRGFLGLLGAGILAAPEIIKGLKGGKKTVQAGKIASKIKLEPAEGMYSWFPDLVEKIKTKGKPFEEKEIIMEASYKHEPKGYGGLPKGVETVTRHVDGDTEFLLREYPDGRLAVDIHSPRNQEGSSTPVTLYYRPTMELKYYSGTKVEPAEFKVLEKEPRYFANGPDDVDIEMSEMRKIPGKNTIYGDVEAAERFATGKIENRKIIPVKQARREQMEDAPTDFIEETSPYGPDTF
jgi:hypothetical protein